MAKVWIFNTDETEEVGKGKHELMLSKQVIAAHGWCKGKGALRTLNKPDPGDVIYYYRAGYGFIASAAATNQNSVQTNEIFNASREYMRPVTEVKISRKDKLLPQRKSSLQPDARLPTDTLLVRSAIRRS